MAEYDYVKSTVDVDNLTLAITNSQDINNELQGILFTAPDSLRITFSGTLDGAEEIALSAIVSAHDGVTTYIQKGYVFAADGSGGGEYKKFVEQADDTYEEITWSNNKISQVDVWKNSDKALKISSTVYVREGRKVVNTVKYIYDSDDGQEIVTVVSGTVTRSGRQITSVTYDREDLEA
jgi:hypothetical protein